MLGEAGPMPHRVTHSAPAVAGLAINAAVVVGVTPPEGAALGGSDDTPVVCLHIGQQPLDTTRTGRLCNPPNPDAVGS